MATKIFITSTSLLTNLLNFSALENKVALVAPFEKFELSVYDTVDNIFSDTTFKTAVAQKKIKVYDENFEDLRPNSSFNINSDIDCSANPNFPASKNGSVYRVSVAGKIGGASGTVVEVNDLIICLSDSASGDLATVGVHFTIIQGNLNKSDYISKDGGTITATDITPPLEIVQSNLTSTHFKKVFKIGGSSIYVSDGTSPHSTLTGSQGDICLNGTGGAIFYCTGTTNWSNPAALP